MRRIVWWAPVAAAVLTVPLGAGGAGAARAAGGGFVPPVRPVITQVFPRDGAVTVDYVVGSGGGAAALVATPVAGDGQALQLQLGKEPDEGRARVSGLVNDTTYVFTLVQDYEIPAVGNPVHRTAVSEPSDEVVPRAAARPGAPIVTDVFPRDGGVRVRWAAADDGGDDLQGYVVTAEPGGHRTAVGADARESVLTGLANDTGYALRVEAVNHKGSGPAAEARGTPREAVRPSAPRSVRVLPVAGDASALKVAWDAPEDDGGTTLGDYRVEVAGRTLTTTDTWVTVTGLDPATGYTPTVTASNTAGASEAAASAAPVRPGVALAARAVPLSQQSADALSDERPGGTLVFDRPTDQVRGLRAGDVLAVPTTRAAPDGLLRKVEQVRTEGGGVLLDTTPADLDEALPEAQASLEGELSGDQVTAARSLVPGVRLQRSLHAGAGLEFGLAVVPDPLVPKETLGVDCALRGEIDIDPHWEFALATGPSGTDVRFEVTGDVKASLDAKLAASFSRTLLDKQIASYTFAPITFFIGPVPVVIVPELALSVQATATGGVEVKFTGTYEQTVGGRLEHTGGAWRTTDLTGPARTTADVSVSPNFSAALSFPVAANFHLYGVAGPGAALVPALTFHADPTASPWATLDLGTTAALTFDVKLLDLTYYANLAQTSTRIWRSTSPFDGLLVTPETRRVARGSTLQLAATRPGCPNDLPVSYRLAEGSTGTLTPDGRYSAPDANDIVTVLATQPANADCPERTAKAVLLVGATKPEAPTGLSAVRDGDQVRLSWRAPENTGDAGPVEYAVIAHVDRAEYTDELEPDALVVLRTGDTGAVVPYFSRDWQEDHTAPADADELRHAGTRYSVVATNQLGASTATAAVDTP
ncbi:fibronectin type III domain-containing protein [Kitasatospora phosalacinea]|uniref:Fibronectin type III domain-containing protein n=1 Tax=Kitasatospora phosalacinea TaxID=2065 RepID=A0ABW6GE76_9ACTN